MRLVIDTNVFVSAALKEASWPGNAVRWVGKFGGLLKTAATEKEVFAVLQRPRIAPKMNGRADVIVSGDDDLLALDTFRGIPIITPAAFGRAQVL